MYNILKNQKSRLTKNPKLLNKIVLTPGQFHWVLTPKELYYSFHPFPIAPCVNFPLQNCMISFLILGSKYRVAQSD